MTEPTRRVLIVEDQTEILELLCLLLDTEGYTTTGARNGVEALVLLGQQSFDAIVSDVHMPEMNGYHLVLQVRDNPVTRELPFVFVSALTSLEEMLQGYALGADDYIKKPVDPGEVVAKLNNIIENKLKHTNINQQLGETRQAAMQAMSYSSYLGQILQFMQNSLTCDTFEALANEVFSVLDVLGLVGSLQFHIPAGIHSFSARGPVSPIEVNIIELARSKGRFFDFEQRTFINHDEFSLLLKNMPLQNPEQYGLYKDVLGNLCTAIEARVKFLLSRNITEQKNQTMQAVGKIITEVHDTFTNIQETNIAAIEQMMADIEGAFLSLGLTENQEDRIRAIVQNCRLQTDAAFEQGRMLGEKLERVHEDLKRETK